VNFSLNTFLNKDYKSFSNVLKFDSKRHYQKLNPITLAKEYENVFKELLHFSLLLNLKIILLKQ